MALKNVDVLRNRVFAIGGHRVSRGANSWTVPAKKTSLDVACFEDVGKQTVKGINEHSLALEGWGTDSERALMLQFIENERSYPFIVLEESNIKNSPVASMGSAALMMDAKLFDIPSDGASHGTVKRFKAGFESAGSPLYFGKTFYTNVGAAALTDGAPFTAPPINLGASLIAGFELAIGVQVLDFPGLLGTDPEVTVEIVSDTAIGLPSPIVRATFDVFTEPDGLMIVLDGDVLAIPSEPFWAPKFTITGTDVEATIMAAIALVPK